MLDKTDKVILTNLDALRAEYGSVGLKRIRSAVNSLIASDKQRGLKTTLIALDDGAIMKRSFDLSHTRAVVCGEADLGRALSCTQQAEVECNYGVRPRTKLPRIQPDSSHRPNPKNWEREDSERWHFAQIQQGFG
jgi:hypothetical protein